MANSKLIIVEGPQGVGKTTLTDKIRQELPCTNLYRLAGTADVTKKGKQKAVDMYTALNTYIKTLENQAINLVFDRTVFTEEIYCRMGKKDYSFTNEFYHFVDELFNMDFDIYYINLFLEDTQEYDTRLGSRYNKALYPNSSYDIKNSVAQQTEYLKLFDELRNKYSQQKNIHLFNIPATHTFFDHISIILRMSENN